MARYSTTQNCDQCWKKEPWAFHHHLPFHMMTDTPYFLIGDDAFPLRPWMVKPYSRRHLDHDERIFNYRLSRAHRVVENAFGIPAMRFQILLGTMQQVPETVDSIVLACTTHHNLLRIRQPAALRQYVDEDDNSHNLVPGQ